MRIAADRDPEALARRARQAAQRGDLKTALRHYQRLASIDPEEPTWPREEAGVLRRQGRSEEELDALIRCAALHQRRGEFLPALATYKMVLSIDPGHLRAQELLDELQPARTVSVVYDDASAPRGGEPAGASGPADSSPLDELVLTEIVSDAHPSTLAVEPLDGVHEIPLDEVVGEPPGGFQAPEGDDILELEVPFEPARAPLERCPLFGSLDREALARLVEQVQLVELRAGAELFHQGDRAGALFIVAEGAVVPIAEGEQRTRLAVLEPGEFFGEIALFTDQPRNATVEALVDTRLLSIDRPVMWRLLREHPEVLSVLLDFLRDRLIDRLIRTSPLFQIFARTKRSSIARRFRFLEVSDGSAVIDQHRPTEAVFILLSGLLEVVHREDPDDPSSEKVLATLGPGELIGEMSLLSSEPALASVIARGKCWLLALPARSFRRLLERHPRLAAMAARIAEERRERNARTLRDALGHRDGKAGII